MNEIYKWKQLPMRDRLAYVSAYIALVVALGLCVASFAVVGTVVSSILAMLGECLLYSASIFIITDYFKHKLEDVQKEITKLLK